MASNKKLLVKRVIEMEERTITKNVEILGNKRWNEKTIIRQVQVIVRRPVWVFGIFKATHNGRQLIAIVEGTYQDALLAVKNPRTETGHSIKGFKKLKDSGPA